MRSRLWPAVRLAVTLCAVVWLTGCSAVRLVYNQAPDITYWWLDGYVDFNEQQSLRAKEALGDWFAWHRRTELPHYAALLSRARSEVAGPATSEQACRWFDELNLRFDAGFERALPGLADVMRRLSPVQIAHLEHKYADNNESLAEDYLQDRPEARVKAQFKRALERIEMVYGRMSSAQRDRIAALALQTPFDPERWLAERQRRQQDTLQTLARLNADQATVEQAMAALRVLVQRSRVSPNDDYRAYQQQLVQFNCGFAAQVHNLSAPDQRAKAAAQLKDWEDDARALAAQAVP
ncbi:MAG: DUF6279 family lipoprotein [Burkholderiaceae bacterium]|nr:DUF6279 family lipoprotein [Burkholderiaceae bacterium]